VGGWTHDQEGGVRRALPFLGLAALAALTIALVAFLVLDLGPRDDEGVDVPIPADPAPAIEATAVFVPRTVGFGDTVRARIDITLDRARVDPDSVRIATDFAPWAQIADPERTRRDGDSTTHLRSMWSLRCLASACLPPAQPLRLQLTEATVTYDGRGPNVGPGQQLSAEWPMLVVQTRLDVAEADAPAAGSGSSPFETPWRAEMVSMPPVTYRIDPDTARLPLFAAAGGFALLGIGLGYLGRPRRRPKLVVAPQEPPPPVLTPIEQALALLEDRFTVDGAADRRRALELLAAELSGRGNDDLAHLARRLAWSRQLPAVERTTPLAEQARPALGLDAEPEVEQGESEEARPGA
jgi:hypothetical protein